MIDEESIGRDVVGGTGITCRVSVTGSKRRFEKTAVASATAGSAIRCSVSFDGSRVNGLRASARLLAYVDQQTGKAVVRMGMFEIGNGQKRGKEIGSQLVWESDTPVFKI